jgi:hypothetical protein
MQGYKLDRAVYYNIIKTQYQGKNYYTLFGIDREGPAAKRNG